MKVEQVSPSLTRSHRLQFSTWPGCVGPGGPPVAVFEAVAEDDGLAVVDAGGGSPEASTQ